MAEVERPSLYGLTDEQCAYVEKMEQLVGARTIAVARNNRFPFGWSFERWVVVLTLGFTCAQFIFARGGDWAGVKSDINDLKNQIVGVHASLETLESRQLDTQRQIESIQRVDEWFRTHPQGGPEITR